MTDSPTPPSGGRDRDRIRIRSCGLIVRDQSLLLLRMDAPTVSGTVWMPPGGEVSLGESLEEAVRREVFEETGLEVHPVRVALIHQFLQPPWHALEFYFLCHSTGGEPRLGRDPDRPGDRQILKEIEFVPFDELHRRKVRPPLLVSSIRSLIRSEGDPLYATSNPPGI